MHRAQPTAVAGARLSAFGKAEIEIEEFDALALRAAEHIERNDALGHEHDAEDREPARPDRVARNPGRNRPRDPERRSPRDHELYLASPDEILGVVAAQDDSMSCVLVVGHNPGLTELVNRLLPDLALDNLPTSGIVAIDLSTPSWRNAPAASAKLAYYDYPKNPELIVTEN